LKSYAVTVNPVAWGIMINITDPDGNRIGVRDELTFQKQMHDSE